MNPSQPDQEHLRTAALELAGQGLTPHDVDQALRLPPGFSRGLLVADDLARAAINAEKTAA